MSDAAASRAEAARLLQRVVVRGQTTDRSFGDRSPAPLVQELVLGSLRHFPSLERALQGALQRSMKPRDRDLWLLMIVGLYQLRHTRIPDHAAIHETVAACAHLRKPWARGLVNGVLRSCARTPPETDRTFDHPDWLAAELRAQYPDADAIMAANNARAPMALRINTRRIGVADYLARLADAGIDSRPAAESGAGQAGSGSGLTGLGPETRILEAPVRARELPGHPDGLVSIQDAGAQFAAGLLHPEAGDRVLDACAAPGGKLFHLLERHPQTRLTALERSSRRLAQLDRERRRLGHDGVELRAGDATGLAWWDGTPFRHVLLDAPCTGTGTLRRHPDIKVLRKAGDMAEFAELQHRMLTTLWRVLEPGGNLLYCTCSILAAENDAVIGRFLAHRSDAMMHRLELTSGRATQHGWQLLPTNRDTDGFYYARMSKASA